MTYSHSETTHALTNNDQLQKQNTHKPKRHCKRTKWSLHHNRNKNKKNDPTLQQPTNLSTTKPPTIQITTHNDKDDWKNTEKNEHKQSKWHIQNQTQSIPRAITEKQYPDSLKTTKLIELYKSKDKTLPTTDQYLYYRYWPRYSTK